MLTHHHSGLGDSSFGVLYWAWTKIMARRVEEEIWIREEVQE